MLLFSQAQSSPLREGLWRPLTPSGSGYLESPLVLLTPFASMSFSLLDPGFSLSMIFQVWRRLHHHPPPVGHQLYPRLLPRHHLHEELFPQHWAEGAPPQRAAVPAALTCLLPGPCFRRAGQQLRGARHQRFLCVTDHTGPGECDAFKSTNFCKRRFGSISGCTRKSSVSQESSIALSVMQRIFSRHPLLYFEVLHEIECLTSTHLQSNAVSSLSPSLVGKNQMNLERRIE